MKKIFYLIVFCCLNTTVFAQFNPDFFPEFTAYPNNPVLKYGDGFADAAWNDPTVIKVGNQYVMYTTAAVGIILSDSNEVKVYRQISSDGINWTLSPSTPVMEPLDGTYYDGGTETPSVIVKDGTYHMYLTCYPPGNDPSTYVIAHATSLDGLAWTMDNSPVLESNGGNNFYSEIVGEPGALVYHDSIHVFFTAAGIFNGNAVQGIGWLKSADGINFGTPTLAFSLPTDVYPLSNDYWGLSTPSALAINDSLYVFTDVAQTINGQWTQVALHQFKTDGVSGIWYYDSLPIHHMQDFPWTSGEYLSNLLAPCPLMEANGELRIWYAGQHLADVVGSDTIYNATIDSTGMIHVFPDFYGIGTSSYQFPGFATVENEEQLEVNIYPNPSNGIFNLILPEQITVDEMQVFNALHQEVAFSFESGVLIIEQSVAGVYFLETNIDGKVIFCKLIVE
jgi:hypothetical protein